MRFFRSIPLLALATVATACELTEVTTAPSDDLVVVEAVLRTDLDPQRILLHRTVQGVGVQPVEGATVTVTGEEDGRVHVFKQGGDCYRIDRRYIEADSLDFQGTCYTAGLLDDHWVIPGQSFELRVETPDGRVARGRTTVPGEFTPIGIPSTQRSDVGHPPLCSLPPDTPLPVAWTASEGAWSYVAQLRITGLRRALEPRGINAPEPLELRGLAISEADTSILLPTQFGVFERFQYEQDLLLAIQNGFPEATQMDLVIAAADRNWVNGVRGGSFNPSGQTRISSVIGDDVVGVFGSLVPMRSAIFVRRQSALLPCQGAG